MDYIFQIPPEHLPSMIESLLWNPLLWNPSYLIIAAIIHIVRSKNKKIRGGKIGVVGMPMAGKTQFYNALKGIPATEYTATAKKDEPAFDCDINGKTVNFDKYTDIGGGVEYIRSYYEDWINSKDILIMVFDARRFYDNPSYKQDVYDRLDFINRKWDTRENKNSQCVVIGSHLDKFSDDVKKTLMNWFQKETKDKTFSGMFLTNFFLLDLTKSEEVKKAIAEILN